MDGMGQDRPANSRMQLREQRATTAKSDRSGFGTVRAGRADCIRQVGQRGDILDREAPRCQADSPAWPRPGAVNTRPDNHKMLWLYTPLSTTRTTKCGILGKFSEWQNGLLRLS